MMGLWLRSIQSMTTPSLLNHMRALSIRTPTSLSPVSVTSTLQSRHRLSYLPPHTHSLSLSLPATSFGFSFRSFSSPKKPKLYKLKTHSGCKKRFKVTGTGKIRRLRTGRAHLMMSKPKRMRRAKKRPAFVAKADRKKIRRMMPYAF